MLSFLRPENGLVRNSSALPEVPLRTGQLPAEGASSSSQHVAEQELQYLQAAAARCRDHRHQPAAPWGGACDDCFSAVVDLDRQLASEMDLPAVPPSHDPLLVDEVAVRRAQAGERVILSPYEWHVVVRLLSVHLSPGQIVHRLQFGGVRVVDSFGSFVRPAARRAAVPTIPSDHVEDIVVEARLAGTSVELTPHELNAACERLSKRGLSTKSIARRLGVRDRTVAKALRSRRNSASPSTVSVLHRSARSVPAPVSPLLGAA